MDKKKITTRDKESLSLFIAIIKSEIKREFKEKNNIYVSQHYKFYDKRRWKFDIAILPFKIGIEVEGGSFCLGRHNRPIGFRNDIEKYNKAVILGWKLLRYTYDQTNLLVNDLRQLFKELKNDNRLYLCEDKRRNKRG